MRIIAGYDRLLPEKEGLFLLCETCVKYYIIRLTGYIKCDILFSEVKLLKRSVYSLVLADDVIKAVDREAARIGTSRSNLINQILAAELSCITPEMRMRDIFDSLTSLVSSSFQIQRQRSASLMTMRTALEYKYRPSINYQVELDRSPDGFIGTLRVHIRTQNTKLIEMFNRFFLYWSAMESARLRELGYDGCVCQLTPVTFVRKLLNTGLDYEQTARAINCYMENLNSSVQAYFSDPSCLTDYSPWLEAQYKSMLEKYII